MQYEHSSYYTNSNDKVSITRSTDEKDNLEYHTFGHIPLSSDEPAAREDPKSSRSGSRRNHRSRLLIIIAVFLIVKILIIKSLVIPYLGQPPPSSPLSPLSTSNPMSSSSTSPSRETVIDLASGSVTGTYSLYDLLSIHTTSGHIDITLSLQNASTSAPKPALLRLSTASGSIRVQTPALKDPSRIPDREYKTSISSHSGSIDAKIPHGIHTSLKTASGSINAELVPLGPNTSRSDIETRTHSSSTDIKLHPSAVNASQPLRKLYADYQLGSGGLRVAYPSTWEGRVQGKTVSGGVDVEWEGLRMVKDRKGYVGREIEAVKGAGEGVLRFYGYSGRVVLRGDGDASLVAGVPARETRLDRGEPGVREGMPSLRGVDP